MNRIQFMDQLERLLSDIPESDRLDAIAFYNDYFDEAGEENEAKTIQELGSPGKVAAIIKADLNTLGNEHAEYTEHGYSDGRMNEGQNFLTRRDTGYRNPGQKRKIPIALIIVLLVFASPMLLGIGGGLLGGVIGLVAGVFGVIVAAVIGGIALLVAGVVSFVWGIIRFMFSPVEGLVYLGMGSLSLAAGIILTILFVWCVFKWFPALFRWSVNLCQRLIHKNEGSKEA